MARTDEPAEVRAGEEVDPERLRAFLAAHVPGASGSIEVRQVPGGYSVLASMWRHERAARIYDGPDEVHKSVVAREVLKPYGVKVEV